MLKWSLADLGSWNKELPRLDTSPCCWGSSASPCQPCLPPSPCDISHVEQENQGALCYCPPALCDAEGTAQRCRAPPALSVSPGAQQVLPRGACSSLPSHSNVGRALSCLSALCLDLCRLEEKTNGHLPPGPGSSAGDRLLDDAGGPLKLCRTVPEEG